MADQEIEPTNKKQKMEDSKEVAPFQVTCVPNSGEPDVTIVVGGKEFREYQQTLRSLSGYFDAAFRSGMKEAQTLRFEFPDRDPKEWELIMALSAPFPTASVHMDNIHTVLSWCDQLCIARGLHMCDETLKTATNFLFKSAIPERHHTHTVFVNCNKKWVPKLLDRLGTAVQYNLPSSKKLCVEGVVKVFREGPYLLDVEHLVRILSFTSEDEECRKSLWGIIQEYLPPSMKDVGDDDMEMVLGNTLLPALIHAEMEKKLYKGMLRSLLEARRFPKSLGNRARTVGMNLKNDDRWSDLLIEITEEDCGWP